MNEWREFNDEKADRARKKTENMLYRQHTGVYSILTLFVSLFFFFFFSSSSVFVASEEPAVACSCMSDKIFTWTSSVAAPAVAAGKVISVYKTINYTYLI